MFSPSYQGESATYSYNSGYPQDNYSATEHDIVDSETHNYHHRQLNTSSPFKYRMPVNTKVEDLPEPYAPNYDCLSVQGENFANVSSYNSPPSSCGISNQEMSDGCWSESFMHPGEIVDDINTWSLDTIKEVASAIEAKPYEDHLAATCEDLPHSPYGSHINTGNAERQHRFDEELPSSLYQTHNEHAGLSQISCGTKKKRKTKLYQLGPQENKELEIKRLRALQAHKNRERKETEERLAKVSIRKMEDEIRSLRKEREDRRFTVSLLEAQLSGLELESGQHERNTILRNIHQDGSFGLAYPE